MIESVVVLGKVAIVCGIGFVVATGFEWFNDMEIKPRKKSVKLGIEKEEVMQHDTDLNDLRKKVRQQG